MRGNERQEPRTRREQEEWILMEYVKFGNTGMDVSRICLGMMSFGKPGKENGVFPWAKDYEEGKAIFKKAIDLGINYFDTANVYQRFVVK